MVKKLRSINKTSLNNYITYALVIVVYIVMQALLSGGGLSSQLSGLLVPICAYIVMAVSLNLTVGIMGELSLGHAGFMSVGAFSGVIAAAALQQVIPAGIPRLVVAMAVGGLFAGIISLIIIFPLLRLRGDYLAIVTLAFGEIIRNIIDCLYVGIDENGLHFNMSSIAALNMSENGKAILQGPMGATGVTKLSTLAVGFALIMLALIVVLNLTNSRSGRAIMALRDNRIAAESIGINPTHFKMTAFITSAVLAGMAGTLYAMNYSSIVAKKFDFNTSILILVFVVLGGIGNIRGSVIAAAALTILPEMLREFNDYRMVVYAIVLILVMLVTNNPTMRSLLDRVKGWFKKRLWPAKPTANSEKGGSAHV